MIAVEDIATEPPLLNGAGSTNKRLTIDAHRVLVESDLHLGFWFVPFKRNGNVAVSGGRKKTISCDGLLHLASTPGSVFLRIWQITAGGEGVGVLRASAS